MFPISDSNGSGRFPFITFLLVLTNVLVFLVELTAQDPDGLIAQYALTPANVDWSNVSTLTPFVTSQFLHAGWPHIIGNLLFLWVFGDNVERRLGIFYLPFYLIAGIIGGLAQYLIDPHSTIPSLGASGAIAGVLGAYLVLFPKNLIKTFILFFGFFTITEVPAPVLLVFWFLAQLFNGVASIATQATNVGGVAYLTHIGGFVFGCVTASFFKNTPVDPLAEGN